MQYHCFGDISKKRVSATVRIMLSYDAESGVLYLSPGGDYVLTE